VAGYTVPKQKFLAKLTRYTIIISKRKLIKLIESNLFCYELICAEKVRFLKKKGFFRLPS